MINLVSIYIDSGTPILTS